ncbi:Gram-positive pilin backbone subunit 2, Cna-B-like domain-containing protein [Bifidobacterium pseudolongum subsp. globosum]|uniref:Gram-positive pilin backbone subunit 2, Cna-B-like domain-containing protein n=1 Tax=Bifidobacterium pseudolongum subsp. globosum TaxID=1690 RepID=A0A4Q5AI64_9BIFI|nr:isopeptide-forming domain-containing fimbrial protein [Bifidobacterium pseudolongum]RYQ27331.1 Gram-positive pilin backbone subunit 2, Cna-B-like domain-containing protein [Bifidobacterium pseudolongum subsp. globosum]RYQ27770.1 Gram-positive pilin backbone subunit 2, Cna-B-like domain-containing protein [Bifidobacterium pseudolongum subsp. globosum]
MKKVWKGFAAAVSAAAIAATGFIGATSAYAEPVGTGTITLTGTVAGDQYKGYRLLNVTGIKGTSVAYEVNDKYEAVLKTALNLTGDNVTDKQIIDSINALKTNDTTTNDDSHNVRAFAAGVMAAINAVNTDNDDTNNINPDLSETASGTSLAFTDISRGYYLFNQTVNGDPDANTDSSFIVDTALDTATNIAVKNGTVTLVKKLQDNDTSNGQTANQWIDGADYNIGDTVPFQLTGTLPKNLTSFDTFNYVFTDTMSPGLTRVTTPAEKALKVYAVNPAATEDGIPTKQNITNSFDVTTTVAQNLAANPKVGETFTVGVKNTGTEASPVYDLKAITTDVDNAPVSITSATQIVVEYYATLNTSAVIGSAGNPNEAKLTFSNNSNHNGTGTTTETPTDKVTVFTYKVDVEKTFDVGAPADNDMPKFTLYKKNAAGTYVEYTNGKETSAEKTVVKGADGKYTIGWEGLDAGEYKLEETYVPAGYNKADDVEFTVTADHDIDSDDPQLNDLGAGDAFTGTASTGSVSTSIENKSGNELPSTGGMGTTILYAAGAAIVLIAGIGLAVTLRRRQA